MVLLKKQSEQIYSKITFMVDQLLVTKQTSANRTKPGLSFQLKLDSFT